MTRLASFFSTLLIGIAFQLQSSVPGFCNDHTDYSNPADQPYRRIDLTSKDRVQLRHYLEKFHTGESFIESVLDPSTFERSTIRPELLKSVITGFSRLTQDPSFHFTTDQTHRFFIHVLTDWTETTSWPRKKKTNFIPPFQHKPSAQDLKHGHLHFSSIKFKTGPADQVLILPSKNFLGLGGKKQAVKAMLMWTWKNVAATIWKKGDIRGDYFEREGSVFDHLLKFPESKRIGILKPIQYDRDTILTELYTSTLHSISSASQSDKIYVAKSLLIALRNLHQLDIVHADLKPENIFVRPSTGPGKYEAVIGDFDVSITRSQMTPGQNVTSEGTPNYVAPERHQFPSWPEDKTSQDRVWKNFQKWDIFSMGIVLHQLFNGSIPSPVLESISYSNNGNFFTDRQKYQAAYDRWVNRNSKKLGKQLHLSPNDEGAQIANFIILSLHPDPEKRPTAQEFLNAFE
ncbi:MAG: protein kinase [Bdellovibrionia bacterium]